MLDFITQGIQHWLGRGSAAVTVPPMDGALKPNNALETAELDRQVAAPDNLVARGTELLFSSGNRVLRVTDRESDPEAIREFDEEILCMAGSATGGLAVAVDGGGVHLCGGPHDRLHLGQAGGKPLGCVVAMTFVGEDRLLVCSGSTVNAASMWQRDLLEREAAGAVWSIDLASGATTLLADHLAFPYGIFVEPGGATAIVAESWRSRLVRIGLDGRRTVETVLDNLPGYPARLAPRARGGAWLAVFAPRSQLVELVLREKAYRRAMMAGVAPEFWVSPVLASGRSFREPMQGGALKQMGILKPWAPTRSYGLVVELDEHFEPLASFHSRADGSRHGVTSLLEQGDRLVVASKGGDALLSLDLSGR